MPTYSGLLGALAIVLLVVFGGSYIYNEALGSTLFFNADLINLVLVGIAVTAITVSIWLVFDEY